MNKNLYLLLIVSLLFRTEISGQLLLQASKDTLEEFKNAVVITASISTPQTEDLIIPLTFDGSASLGLDFDVDFVLKNTISHSVIDSKFYEARDLIVDSYGDTYILTSSNVFKKNNRQNNFTKVAGGDGSGLAVDRFQQPSRIYVDEAKNIFVSNSGNSRVEKWTNNSSSGLIVAGGGGFGNGLNQLYNPKGLIRDSGNNLFIADTQNNRIMKWDISNQSSSVFSSSLSLGDFPTPVVDVAYDLDSNFYALGFGEVVKWDKGSTVGKKLLFSDLAPYMIPSKFKISQNGTFYAIEDNIGVIGKWNFINSKWDILINYNNPVGTKSIRSFDLDNRDNLYWIDYDSGPNNEVRLNKKIFQPSIIIKAGDLIGDLTIFGLEDRKIEGNETIEINIDSLYFDTNSSNSLSLILRDNVQEFQLVNNIGIPNLSNPSHSWGDYDLDGDMDLAIMGFDFLTGVTTKILRNDNGVFVDVGVNLTRVQSGDIEWVDLNNDSYLDIALTGLSTTNSKITEFYFSNAGSSFSGPIDMGVTKVSSSTFAFGDTNNDGWVDIAIQGLDQNDKPILELYERDKKSLFFKKNNFYSPSNVTLHTLKSELTLADFDKDDDVDLFFNAGPYLGFEDNSFSVDTTSSYINGIYYISDPIGVNATTGNLFNDRKDLISLGIGLEGSNNGFYFSYNYYEGNLHDNFKNIESQLDLRQGGIQIGDFNSDGKMDLIVSGKDALNTPNTKLFLQKSLNDFDSQPLSNFEGLYNTKINSIDYDGDGDLDIFLTGMNINNINKTLLYRNDLGNKINRAPSAPDGLQIEILENGYVKFSWNQSTDDYSDSLGYNIRIGSTVNSSEFALNNSDPFGGKQFLRTIPRTFKRELTLQMNPGKYYWAVQAVDHSGIASPFSQANEFLLQYNWKLVNQGGLGTFPIYSNANYTLTSGDFDNDGDIELYYGGNRYNYDNNRFLRDNFSSTVSDNDFVSDVNGDGYVDVISNSLTNNLSVRFNQNGNSFSYPISLSQSSLTKTTIAVADLDRDGNQDIIIGGLTSSSSSGITKLYSFEWNGSSFNYTDLSSQIQPLISSSFDFGDINNDGTLDFILSGAGVNGITALVYYNTTTPGEPITFTETPISSLASFNGTLKLNDLDADGDLDILISGLNSEGEFFKTYLNSISNGTASFTLSNSNLPSIVEVKTSLGDFNHDGYTDIFYSGIDNGVSKITRLVEFQPTSGTYLESNFNIDDITDVRSILADIDGDNDMDLVLSGKSQENQSQSVFKTFLNVRNESAAANNENEEGDFVFGKSTDNQTKASTLNNSDYVVNKPPSKPMLEKVEKISSNGDNILRFSWLESVDDHSPTPSLTYNLRVGTSANANNVFSSNSSSSGQRSIVKLGNMGARNSFDLKQLPDGTYYWAIQAIDGSFIGSEFSSSNKFTIQGGNLITNAPPILNNQNLSISDFIPNGQSIGVKLASDLDSPTLTYAINSGDPNNWFIVNSNGFIEVNNRPIIFPDNIELSIQVSDGENVVSANVDIKFCNKQFVTLPSLIATDTKTFNGNSSIEIPSVIPSGTRLKVNSSKSIIIVPGSSINQGSTFLATISDGCEF